MRRRVLHGILVVLLGTVPLVLGVLSALILTDPGRDLLARTASRMLDSLFRGDLEIGSIEGSFLFGLKLEDVVLKDTAGVTLAEIPAMSFEYQIPNLMSGRFILNDVVLVEPSFNLIQHRNGRMNYEEILKLGEGDGTGRPPLFEIHGLTIKGGELRLALPWNPDDTVQTAEAVAEALATQRAEPGRIIVDSPEGPRKVLVARDLNLKADLVRISTPADDPIFLAIDSLAAQFNDPALDLRDFAGTIEVENDSARIEVSHAELPNTRFSGEGVVSFTEGPIMLDLDLDVPQVDLRDVRGFVPDLPSLSGRLHFEARSETPTRTVYNLTDMHLSGGATTIDGRATAVVDEQRGFSLSDFDLAVVNAGLDLLRPYLDTLPLYGTVTGNLSGRGTPRNLAVRFDLAFTDSLIETHPVSRVAGGGRLSYGGASGVTFFSGFTLESSDLALATVRSVVPAVVLEGRGSLSGTLEGPWQNIVFDGTIRHQDGGLPVSEVVGTVHLDARSETLGIETDLRLNPLSFDGIRQSFPGLEIQGQVTGTLRTSGTLERLMVDADLTGDAGSITASGAVTLLPPRLGADSLIATFQNLDLSRIAASAPSTDLQGRILVSGSVDTLRAPEGSVRLTLGPGTVREVAIDSAFTRFAIRDSVITVDTLAVAWANGDLAGSGTLGWVEPHEGSLNLEFQAASLAPFDSIITALTGMERDSLHQQLLAGVAEGELQLDGSLDNLVARGDFVVRDLAYRDIASREVSGTFGWSTGDNVAVTIESPLIQYGEMEFQRIDLAAGGQLDSLEWSGSVQLGAMSSISGSGLLWQPDSTQWILKLATLQADLPEHRWRLVEPTRISVSEDAIRVAEFEMRPVTGGARVYVDGEITRGQQGELQIEGYGIDLRDIYGLIQRDTAGVSGTLGMDIAVGGTFRKPTITGTMTVGDLSFGDFQAPFVQAVFNYEDRELNANLLLWRTGVQVLTVEANLPLDLGFTGVEDRQIPGELYVRAVADSVDLALLEAFASSARNVRGLLNADVEITGTWDRPELSGFLEVENGAATLPSLGVRYGHITGRMVFQGDSIIVERLRATSGPGDVILSGSIRLERLTDPTLNLALKADRFRVIDDRSFLSLVMTGNATIKGPVIGAVLDGSAVANSGVLHFADLINKQVVDLSDPLAEGLVDTTLIRRENLGAALPNVFMDSLRIRGFRLEVGDEFWLRSSDANIQLDGEITIDKTGDRYDVDGTLNALRGTYTLHIGYITRDFEVVRGQVRYFGTPDLNAAIDIRAVHVVQTDGGDIPIIANISGTLLQPTLELTSTIRPEPTETELVSYLLFGTANPESQLAGSQASIAVNQFVAFLSSALSSEVERALVSDFGIPIDYVEIRTGYSTGIAGSSLTQATFGWQLGNDVFLTVNAAVCGAELASLGRQGLGVGLEYRLARGWRVKASVEPLRICTLGVTSTTINSDQDYQLGFDLLWEKEY